MKYKETSKSVAEKNTVKVILKKKVVETPVTTSLKKGEQIILGNVSFFVILIHLKKK